MRATLYFSPKPASRERICAGVVTRLSSGEVSFTCAVDLVKARHAFGDAGLGIHAAAQGLCQAFAEHWSAAEDVLGWTPPFESAELGELAPFSASSAETAQEQMLSRVSSLHTLFKRYEMPANQRLPGIVRRVRTAVKSDRNAQHLLPRFSREIQVGPEAGTLSVDFLGQHFACYFVQLSRSERGVEATTDRAFTRLYELSALRRFVRKPKKSMGLLDDERPTQFELLLVASETDPVQRRAIRKVEALADKDEIRLRTIPGAQEAANHVAAMERLRA